jgi:hypothetical protein
MNTHLYPPSQIRARTTPPNRQRSKANKTRFTEPHVPWYLCLDEKWINHYDEEWIAFLRDKSPQKRKNAGDHLEPELLPRVWNIPRH